MGIACDGAMRPVDRDFGASESAFCLVGRDTNLGIDLYPDHTSMTVGLEEFRAYLAANEVDEPSYQFVVGDRWFAIVNSPPSTGYLAKIAETSGGAIESI